MSKYIGMDVKHLENGIIGEIGSNGYLVLEAILAYSDNGERTVEVTIDKIADSLGFSYRTVIRTVKDLTKRGYLSKEIVQQDNGRLVNKFTILDDRFEI